MAIEIKIEDSDLEGFSDPAKSRLSKATEDYVSALIQEANRIEASRNTGSGPPEVTNGMVSDAVIVQRQGLGTPQKSWASKFIRIVAAVLALIVGVMYDPAELQNKNYLAVFVVLIAATIITTTIAVLKE